MSRQGELAKNTIILSVGKICTQFITFFLLPLYTKVLSPSEYGTVDLFITYIALILPLVSWQLDQGLFRFMIEDREDFNKQKQVFTNVFLFNICQSIIYLILFIVFKKIIDIKYLWFIQAGVVLNIFSGLLLQFSRGVGKNIIYSTASFISASATVLLNVIFLTVIKTGINGLFYSILIAQSLTILYLLIVLKMWRYISFKSLNISLLKKICLYSLPLIPNQLAWWVMGVSDRTIISMFIGLGANGIYSIANKFSSIFITFYNMFNMSWTESVSLYINDRDSKEFLSNTINTLFDLFSSLCILIIVVIPFAFPLLIDAKYNDAYYQIPILMLAVLSQVVVGLYSVIYIAMKKSVEIAKTSFFSAAINLSVNLMLVKYLGIFAASISTLAAYLIMAVYRYHDVQKYFELKLAKKKLIRTMIMLCVTILCYYISNTIINVILLAAALVYFYKVNNGFLNSIKAMIRKKIKGKA